MGIPLVTIAAMLHSPRAQPLSTRQMIPSAARRFYEETLRALVDARVQFVVGGALALKHWAGIARDTKDLDVFLRRSDVQRAMGVLAARGFTVEVPFPHWLGKVWCGLDFVDVIYDSANGLSPVDDEWFEHAPQCSLWGIPVLVCPAEELIMSKAFVMERERFDGADIYHLLEAHADKLDWSWLLKRFGEHWEVLLGHLLFFSFAYPRRRTIVPPAIMKMLLERARAELGSAPDVDVCRGTLLSREQYLVDLRERGYTDARIPPWGRLDPAEIELWTAAIPADGSR
jgi:hypothetical protein